MKQWIIDEYWHWIYSRDHAAADSIYSWWWCVKRWIAYHPRLIDCAAKCGNQLWSNKKQNGLNPQFCSESCAYYGWAAFEQAGSDEVPF